MLIEVKVPSPGESISEVQLAGWLVENGSYVEKDTDIAEIDSDKATLTVAAEESGAVTFKVEEGETVDVGAIIATIDTSAEAPAGTLEKKEEKTVEEDAEPEPKAETEKQSKAEKSVPSDSKPPPDKAVEGLLHISPLAKKLLEENQLTESEFIEFFRKFRASKKDVEFFLDQKDKLPSAKTIQPATNWGGRETERSKMSTLRLKVAERLVSVKNETAMLTTFNEVNMTPIMEIRKKYKEVFKEKHGVSLGFMSFFTKAITEALQLFPQVNAQIIDKEIQFHNYADIGIAVSSPKGLMVPVLRNAETMSLAEIEKQIKALAVKARDGKISLDEMKGGTFTITNGGVFGSMLSTPIINPPQSAILGMHNIVERPIAVDGKVEIHPIMYVALSYDHRIIDGKESVSFLVKIKEMLEDPARMLFKGNEPVQALLDL
jgi:2-oxoglutarate dehydrogenase E2 component (dihydrolipoamide succinyltransferase)